MKATATAPGLFKALRLALGLLSVIVLAFSTTTARAAGTQAEKVKEALQIMRSEAAKLGEPKLDGSKLVFGQTRINGDYTIVDDLRSRYGCTATFFVTRGTDYVRISTNVINEGNRALGTVLSPTGPAYAAISKGEAYYGLVDILGKKYEAGYEPVKDAAGTIIGVYYVGFLLEP